MNTNRRHFSLSMATGNWAEKDTLFNSGCSNTVDGFELEDGVLYQTAHSIDTTRRYANDLKHVIAMDGYGCLIEELPDDEETGLPSYEVLFPNGFPSGYYPVVGKTATIRSARATTGLNGGFVCKIISVDSEAKSVVLITETSLWDPDTQGYTTSVGSFSPELLFVEASNKIEETSSFIGFSIDWQLLKANGSILISSATAGYSKLIKAYKSSIVLNDNDRTTEAYTSKSDITWSILSSSTLSTPNSYWNMMTIFSIHQPKVGDVIADSVSSGKRTVSAVVDSFVATDYVDVLPVYVTTVMFQLPQNTNIFDTTFIHTGKVGTKLLYVAYTSTIETVPITEAGNSIIQWAELTASFRTSTSCSSLILSSSSDYCSESNTSTWTSSPGVGGWGLQQFNGTYQGGQRGGTLADYSIQRATSQAQVFRSYVPAESATATWVKLTFSFPNACEPIDLQSIGITNTAKSRVTGP